MVRWWLEFGQIVSRFAVVGLVCSLWVWFAVVGVLAVGLEFLSVGLYFIFFCGHGFCFQS